MRPHYEHVVFDCDSTLSAMEGIDELCDALPRAAAEEVQALTNAAMEGALPLEEVYERRLAIVRPSAADLEAIGRRYVERLVPGAREVVATLREHDIEVGIVSGGLLPAVRVLARELALPDGAVEAVDVTFATDGSYLDFDHASPLWRNHGKVDVLAALRARRSPLLFVGDGVTDLEAKDVVDCFAGFGGVARRPVVEQGSEVYSADPDLGFVLNLVFGERPARESR